MSLISAFTMALDINESTMSMVAATLQQTMSPDAAVRKPAEEQLRKVETQRNYALLLLQMVSREGGDQAVRIAGAIAFKNFVKRNWKVVRPY